MSTQFVVREVKLPTGCWPRQAEIGEPNLVCPLCAIENSQDTQLTARFSTHSGYILCNTCDRLSGIYMADGTADGLQVIPAKNAAVLVGIAELALIRTALDGSGHLLEFVSRDNDKPIEVVSLMFQPIIISDDALGDFPPSNDLSDSRFALISPALRDVPESVKRLLGSGQLTVNIG